MLTLPVTKYTEIPTKLWNLLFWRGSGSVMPKDALDCVLKIL